MKAVRTVSETDDVHVIEGLLAYGGPFAGRDSYGTIFSARTDFGLDLHPSGLPILFDHGFDPEIGLTPLGHTGPTASFRSDADGLWVQMQLDKREKYYATRVRPLLDKDGLGVSQGSAEHSVKIDARSGEVKNWPLHEISLTPTESNPYSVVAARSAETVAALRIVGEQAETPPPEPEPEPPTPAETTIAAIRALIGLGEEPAVRVGKRNSAPDQALIDTIHTATVGLGSTAHGNDTAQMIPAEPDSDDAARSGDPVPAIKIVEPVNPAAFRAELLANATKAGQEAAKRLTG